MLTGVQIPLLNAACTRGSPSFVNVTVEGPYAHCYETQNEDMVTLQTQIIVQFDLSQICDPNPNSSPSRRAPLVLCILILSVLLSGK